MPLSFASHSSPWIPCLVALLAVSACKEKYEMVTAALDTVSVSEGVSTGSELTTGTDGGSTGGTTQDVPTTSDTNQTGGNSSDPTTGNTTNTTQTSNTSNTTNTTDSTTTMGTGTSTTWDPETTGPPATCDGPEDCTTEGSGDFGAMVLPFFRGEVCVSDKLRPDDMMAVWLNPCVHPCIDAKKHGWRYIFRCTGGVGCEIAFMQYYREAAGSQCPVDAFYKFDPALCKYAGPHKALTMALPNLGNPEDKVLFPFVTNEDAAPISMMEANAAVWLRIDGHAQAAERYFPLTVSEQNPAPPTECGPGVAGCTCKQIGF